jgi:hypothetical protein
MAADDVRSRRSTDAKGRIGGGGPGARAACGLAIDPPRLTRDGKRHAKTQQHEQKAPFGHGPMPMMRPRRKCPSHDRPLGIGERGDEQREQPPQAAQAYGRRCGGSPSRTRRTARARGKRRRQARTRDVRNSARVNRMPVVAIRL